MTSNKTIIICLVIFQTVLVQTLIELSLVNNDLKNVETVIRNTVNDLFENFNIENVKDDQKLKQYSTMHDLFVVNTLHDSENLKEVARLTQVNNVDNDTQDFIAHINEVLNDEDISNEENVDNSVSVKTYIDMFINKLRYLKDKYMSDEKTAINADILKHLFERDSLSVNINNDSNSIKSKKILSDSDTWQSSARRIYRGKRTHIKDFPFLASIHFFRKFHCAGSIIKNDLVITSSSCLQIAWNNRFFRENPAFLSVQVGSDFYKSGSGEIIAVLDIHFHPSYDPKTMRHNLAIIRLIRKINFKKTKRVRKIDFDRNPWQLPIHSGRVTLVGWGAKDERNLIDNAFKNRLSYADLKIYPHYECQEFYSRELVTKSNFCVGSNARGSGACNLDAGGPGTIENILMGVISFGTSFCGVPDTPTVLTKLGHYTDWIETIMEQEVPHYKKRTTEAYHYVYLEEPTTTKSIPSFTPMMSRSSIPQPTGEPLDLEKQFRADKNEAKLFKQFLEFLHGNVTLKSKSKESNERASQQVDILPKESLSKNQSNTHKDKIELINEIFDVQRLKKYLLAGHEKERQQRHYLNTLREKESYTKNPLILKQEQNEDELFKVHLPKFHVSEKLNKNSKLPYEKANQKIDLIKTLKENESYAYNQSELGQNEDEVFKEIVEILFETEELKAYNGKNFFTTALSFKTSNNKLTTAILHKNPIPYSMPRAYMEKYSYIQALKNNVKRLLSRPDKIGKHVRDYVVMNNYTKVMDRIKAVVKKLFIEKNMKFRRPTNHIDRARDVKLTTKAYQRGYLLRKYQK